MSRLEKLVRVVAVLMLVLAGLYDLLADKASDATLCAAFSAACWGWAICLHNDRVDTRWEREQ